MMLQVARISDFSPFGVRQWNRLHIRGETCVYIEITISHDNVSITACFHHVKIVLGQAVLHIDLVNLCSSLPHLCTTSRPPWDISHDFRDHIKLSIYTSTNTFFKDTLTISIIAFRPATGVSCRRGDPVMAPAAEGLPRDINLHT
jgi:hypothetical protein